MTERSPTLRSLLFGPDSGAFGRDTADALESDPALDALFEELGGATQLTDRKALVTAILERAPDLFGMEIGRILAGGWRKWEELRSYADPSRYPPDETILVELAAHEIRSRHEPGLELVVNDRTIGRIDLDAELSFALGAAVLTVRDGRIHAVKTGTCEVTGSLEWEGHSLARWQSRTLDLPGTFELHPPFEIRPSTDEP